MILDNRKETIGDTLLLSRTERKTLERQLQYHAFHTPLISPSFIETPTINTLYIYVSDDVLIFVLVYSSGKTIPVTSPRQILDNIKRGNMVYNCSGRAMTLLAQKVPLLHRGIALVNKCKSFGV